MSKKDFRDQVKKNASSIFTRSSPDPQPTEEVELEKEAKQVKVDPPAKKAVGKKKGKEETAKAQKADFAARKRGRPVTTRKAGRVEGGEQTQEALDSTIRFMVTNSERQRIEAYLDDPWTRDSSLSEVCRNALLHYLEGQEKKLEKIKEKLGNLSL